MGKLVGLVLYILQTIKSIGPFFAFLFFATWTIRFVDEATFETLDNYLSPIPNLIDSIYRVESDIMGSEVTMGYVIFSAILCVLIVLSYKYEYKVYTLKKYIEDEEARAIHSMNKLVQESMEREEIKKQKIESLDTFYGLFELNIQYQNPYGKDPQKLEQVKRQLYAMIYQKLKENYEGINFETRESLFFNFVNFSKFHSIIQDIVTIYRGLKEINKNKGIKTELMLSFWGGNTESSVKGVYKILKTINKLGYKNKIILSSGVYYKYQKEEKKILEFASLGLTKMIGMYSDGSDLDVTLFCVKSIK